MNEIRFKQDGGNVLILLDGRLIANMPWDKAQACWQGLRSVAKLAEEYALANDIIADQALLLRIGANIGLTSHPKMQEEAAKEAAWNRDLRRYLPSGIKSKEQMGAPAIIQYPPKKGVYHGK